MTSRDESRRRALQAAARVTFSLTAIACASREATAPGAGPAPGSTTAPARPTRVPPGVPLACGLPASGPYAEDTVACCAARIKAALPPPMGSSSPARPGLLAPPDQACCEAMVSAGFRLGGPLDYMDLMSCCSYVPGAFEGTSRAVCAPWGPPMPPAMPLAWRGDMGGWA